MVRGTDSRWESLEHLSPALFVAGGVLMGGHAALMAARAVLNVTPPPDIFAPVGTLLVFAGLAGQYRRLADHPLAVVGAVGVGLGTMGFASIAAGTLAQFAGWTPPGWTAVFTPVAIVGVVSSFLAFGLASLRTGRHTRLASVLLLAPGLVFGVMVATMILTGPSAIDGVLGGGSLSLAYLAIGGALQADSPASEVAAPTGDDHGVTGRV